VNVANVPGLGFTQVVSGNCLTGNAGKSCKLAALMCVMHVLLPVVCLTAVLCTSAVLQSHSSV
jgi:hypothetical protein